jgi:hypothetical protein
MDDVRSPSLIAARGLRTGIAGGPDDINRAVELLEERGIGLKGEHVALVDDPAAARRGRLEGGHPSQPSGQGGDRRRDGVALGGRPLRRRDRPDLRPVASPGHDRARRAQAESQHRPGA